ncbi:hypothetical protein VPG91_22445 [Nitrospirillum amazonense]|uniref:hypothetical protein n=1 Tax=Nitrospirillum amazonense TaxID=28077 RepID=UPI002DD4368F|nr:hypothetical protein [Nitrospirillum amazonense]MEC4593778.1 hypothetical protein [Nitrospirillum amazonense]
MALIQCEDCGRDVSDRAPACPNCGCPIAAADIAATEAPTTVTVSGDKFIGTKALLIKLSVKAIQSLNYKVDAADETSGLVSFTTGMTWGSWSGVSGSIYFDEVEPFHFEASGNAKQNVKGRQIAAFDIWGEAKGKVDKVIQEMRLLASR